MRPGLALPARQVFANLGRALAAAGPRHVAKITIHAAGTHECLPAIGAARASLFTDHKPAVTVVGVETLARPEYLIDVHAIAVIDR